MRSNKNIKVAVIVDAGWEAASNGVATFLRVLNPNRQDVFDCSFVECPEVGGGDRSGVGGQRSEVGGQRSEEHCPSSVVSDIPSAIYCAPRTKHQEQIPASSFRLFLGYLQLLLRDLRFVWSVRKRLRGAVIVVNEFGCETLPIAVRLVFPFSRIVAISHTHPGMLADARHPVRRSVEEFCAMCVSDVVFNSQSLMDCWGERIRSIPKKRSVIHYGIPEPSADVPADYPEKKQEYVDFVCGSRFVYWKGHRQLLDAWKLALESCPNLPIRLILVGDGPTFGEMQAHARELNVSDSVVFLGAKKNGAAYFSGGDVGVLPSIEPEAFGLVLLEAMCRGLPVLASNLGGIPEIVVDDETGLLVDPMDVEQVASAIVRLATDRELRITLGQNGKKRWKEHFSEPRMLEEYKRVLGGPS